MHPVDLRPTGCACKLTCVQDLLALGAGGGASPAQAASGGMAGGAGAAGQRAAPKGLAQRLQRATEERAQAPAPLSQGGAGGAGVAGQRAAPKGLAQRLQRALEAGGW